MTMSHLKSTLLATTLLATLAVAPALAETTAGVAAAVNPQANATAPSAPTRLLEVGSNVVMNEKIVTGAEGQTQLLFRDGSTVTVGPSANLTIDTFVYDPEKRTAKLAMTAASGLIRFVGGRASKEEGGVTVTTPSATIGIRGGIADIGHDPQTGTTNANFLFGSSMNVKTPNSQTTLDTPGFGFTVGRDGSISPPLPVTNQSLAQNNKKIEGKGGKGGSGGNNPSNSPDNNAGGVSNANSSAPPPPPPLSNTLTNLTRSDSLRTDLDKVRSDTGQGSNNDSSTFGSTSSPRLSSSDHINVAGIVPDTSSESIVLTPKDDESHKPFTYTNTYFDSNGNPISSDTTTESSAIKVDFSNNQLNGLDFKRKSDTTSVYNGQSTNYTYLSSTHVDFVGTTLSNVTVDKDVALVVLSGGSINITDTNSYSNSTPSTTTSTYKLLPTDKLPFAFGRPIDPALMPTSGLWTYNLTAATPVFFSDGSATGQLTKSILTVYFGGSPSQGYNNVAASWSAQGTIGSETFIMKTGAGPTAAQLASVLSNSNSSITALTGNSARGDLSGQFTLLLAGQCPTGCTGQASGFFAGAKGQQVALAYQAQGNTSRIVGGVSMTRNK
jgi:hypothetical protein